MFGINALIMLSVIFLTVRLSARGMTDTVMMHIGLAFSIVGYTLLYVYWKRDVHVVMFAFPFFLCTVAFPFLGAPTRSVFTLAVSNNEYLADHQGTMQAIMSMMSSVGGFVAPGLIAAYVLRTSDEVDASLDDREFTSYALFAPILSLITMIGLFYVQHEYEEQEKVQRESMMTELTMDERLALLNPDVLAQARFHHRVEANRRASVMIMQIPQLSFAHEVTPKTVNRQSSIF
jgi:uncharacterized membrane protein